jgi:surface carbohydrate biosynthesis protein
MLETASTYFAWGEKQATILQDELDFPLDKVVVSGEPRFDLLQQGLRRVYQEAARDILDEYGEFVLINTIFALVNHGSSTTTATVEESGVTVQVDESELAKRAKNSPVYNSEAMNYKLRLLQEFVTMAERLAETVDCSVIIRPHPSESHKPYKALAEVAENVLVKHSGDVRPWILAAKAVIHNSCTTGIESALLETPVFAYRPVQSNKYDVPLPNIVSEEVTDFEALRAGIVCCLNDPAASYELSPEQTSALREYLINIDGELAAERIAETIDIFEREMTMTGRLPSPGLSGLVKRLCVRHLGTDTWEDIINLLPLQRFEYKQQKFPSLTSEEIATECQRFESYLEFDTDDIRIEEVSGLMNVFSLSVCV